MSDSRNPPAAAAAVVLVGIALVVALTATDHASLAVGADLLTIVLVVGLKSRPLELAVDVGHSERHRVVFRFNKFWGNLSITVDGVRVVGDLRMFSASLTKTYELSVGDAEAHRVRIEKDRALFLAGTRPQPVRAYVDGVLSAEGVV